jgi:hypothetical protein
MTSAQGMLDILAHGERLNAHAHGAVGNVNEAHLLVHGVMARAMDARSAADGGDLDLALARSLRAWREPEIIQQTRAL